MCCSVLVNVVFACFTMCCLLVCFYVVEVLCVALCFSGGVVAVSVRVVAVDAVPLCLGCLIRVCSLFV